ncbi:MAG TPA: ABC transporter ATP-binding protein [Clostridiales bacterium]|nr:ABC transporter ATP-binding protein [Clostridiales bacterium]
MEFLIEVKGLYKIYKQGANEVHALKDINLKISRGEMVAVVGRSGSGKSTLMNILGCLDTPTLGEYYLDGKAVNKLKENQLSEIRSKYIGFIFQGFNLIPTLTALENIELPLCYQGIHKQKRRELAKQALCMVGLENRMHHYPSELSGGQQQRVAIARAIAAKPPLILADEPTGNLDSQSGKQIMDILFDLNSNGKTIVLITHDKEIAKLIPRRINIADGRLV